MAIDRDLHLNTIVSQDMGSPGQDCMGKNKQLGPECSLRNKKTLVFDFIGGIKVVGDARQISARFQLTKLYDMMLT
uniref:Uncharacterized protein n=1 Tax=Magallana gigas TaxID=29159 RepID=K1PDF6_MAGGI